MEDYIYTLLVIAWIVYGVVKAAKKKKDAQAPQAHPAYSTSESEIEENPISIDGVLGDFFKLEQEKKDETSHYYEMEDDMPNPDYSEKPEKYATEKKLDSYAGSDNTLSVFAKENTPESVNTETDESIEYQLENFDENQDFEEFNLRQAVIHQVILERPY